MAKKNRSTLKRYFQKGRLPTEDQFGDLVDSTLNQIDEGFDKSPERGFEISLIGKHKHLISFFKAGAPKNAVWTIEYDEEQDRLLIKKPARDSSTAADTEPPTGIDSKEFVAMTFSGAGHIGVNNPDPIHALDVGGVIASHGRLGANQYNQKTGANRYNHQKTVAADGVWHDIVGPLQGCHAIEVVAGAGKKDSGKYALVSALAMNTFNPRGWLFNFLNLKKRIKYHHAYYLSRGNRIELNWENKEDGYYLQMRTRCGYGGDVKIRYYLTQLWFDEDMSESWQTDEPGQ